MKKLAVIGNPISHSLSPVMHNAALKYLGLNYEYSAVEVKKEELAGFISDKSGKYSGFNVTVPHKTAIIPLLDSVDKSCLLGESVNTVEINDQGKLHGSSTDGYGLEKALEEIFNIRSEDVELFFIGCGGAAKAVAAHFLAKGVKGITFANRTVSKAAAFVEKIKKYYPNIRINYCSLYDSVNIKSLLDVNPVVIQSTSLGLKDSDPTPFDEMFFRKDLRVFDMIYRKTKFLELAAAGKCVCAGGELMLLYQGARSFKKWTGVEPPIDIMKKALISQLTINN